MEDWSTGKYIYIFGCGEVQAKYLESIHWAVISSPRADICLFLKSAKKERLLALYMEIEFSMELGEYSQYSVRGEYFTWLHAVWRSPPWSQSNAAAQALCSLRTGTLRSRLLFKMTLNYLPEILKSWRIISKRKYYPLEKFQVVGENRHFLSAQVYHIVSLIKL